MAAFKPKVFSLIKRPGNTFGFYLRIERGEEGHLIRCLEMGGPAQLAGMKDGDRVLRVNGTFVDGLPHSEVVELVRDSGASVTFHILDEASYKQAKAQGVNLTGNQSISAANGVDKHVLKPKLCFIKKTGSSYGFSVRSVKGEEGFFMTEVSSGGEAYKAGVRGNDRLLEINGENVEGSTHDKIVHKIKKAGDSIMLLLVDDETDKYYRNKRVTIGAWLATTKYLPLKPRIIDITKGSDGYGFLLKEEPKTRGHIIRDIDRGSPAEREGLKEMDRLVAVDGKEVQGCGHDQVVDMIKLSGNNCCFFVVDKDTDQMFQLGKVSPMIFWDEMRDFSSPPSYIEAVNSTASRRPSTPEPERMEELKLKLCKMERTPAGFGFHLNGIQGVCGQYIKEVVKGGAADRAGMEDDDFVVEVNGINVEQRHHEDVVEMIRSSGNTLEMLVINKSSYDQLKARGVTVSRQLLGETSYVEVHQEISVMTLRERHEEEEDRRSVRSDRSGSSTHSARQRTSSSSSEGSIDVRF